MSPIRPKVDVFGCSLEILDREGDRFLVRARLKAPGLAAGSGTVVQRGELEDLLEQVERQYANLAGVVSWATQAAPTVKVGWRKTLPAPARKVTPSPRARAAAPDPDVRQA